MRRQPAFGRIVGLRIGGERRERPRRLRCALDSPERPCEPVVRLQVRQFVCDDRPMIASTSRAESSRNSDRSTTSAPLPERPTANAFGAWALVTYRSGLSTSIREASASIRRWRSGARALGIRFPSRFARIWEVPIRWLRYAEPTATVTSSATRTGRSGRAAQRVHSRSATNSAAIRYAASSPIPTAAATTRNAKRDMSDRRRPGVKRVASGTTVREGERTHHLPYPLRRKEKP